MWSKVEKMIIKFTAAIFLSALADLRPTLYPDEGARLAVIAVAAFQAKEEYLPKWNKGDAQLSGAIVSALIHESGLMKTVHSGEHKGPDRCLTQISRSNRLFPRVGAPSREALTGLDMQSTQWCLDTGTLTLTLSNSHCKKRRYFKNWQAAMWISYQRGRKCWPPTKTTWSRVRLQNKVATTEYIPTEQHQLLVDWVISREKEIKNEH